MNSDSLPKVTGGGRRAMNTLFEMVTVDGDAENRVAAMEGAWEEIERVEKLLSRFDPAAEVARLNREAPVRPVLMDQEMTGILALCRDFFQRTGGHFDITAVSQAGRTMNENIERDPPLQIDFENRLLRFSHPHIFLDFGAFGKGYALDRAAGVLQRFDVRNYLMHGGTSSVLAAGRDMAGQAWRIGLRDPRADDATVALEQIELRNEALSSSGAFGANQKTSDIIHAPDRNPLLEPGACSVIATTAVEAEIFSTAFLSMGKRATGLYLTQSQAASLRVAWINETGGRGRLEWLQSPGPSGVRA